MTQTGDGVSIAASIRLQAISAQAAVQLAIAAIEAVNPQINCFTALHADRALASAYHLDRALCQRNRVGALAGVPFAVKNLFDIAGVTTLAGSKINQDNPAAEQDATAITRLKQAGAILMGHLNMDEYAYGFVTVNAHYGTTRNPHALEHLAGGSSGGSAAAVAAGLVAVSLGTDTNGSVRIPAAFCGVYGLKPTYGRLSRAGVTLLSSSLDHVGILARSVRDLATVFDFVQGPDPRDPVCTRHPPDPLVPQLGLDPDNLRYAVAGGYFGQGAQPEAIAAVAQLARVLGAHNQVILPQSEQARAAAYLITATEGANEHLHQLQSRLADFDPAVRDRLVAGALIPSQWYLQAQRFRRWYRDRLRELFRHVDVILAPTTPFPAPRCGQETIAIAGETVAVRQAVGRFTQPLSFVGLPVLSVPIQRPHGLPLGVQLIAAPYKEAMLLRVAGYLEREGHIAAPIVEVKS